MPTGRKFKLVAVLGATILSFGAAGAAAQSGPDDEVDRGWAFGDRVREAFRNLNRIMDSAQTLGPWDEQYEYILRATDNVYAQQGWTSESDQFSLSVVREVSAIPPWEPLERFNRMTGMLSDRYGLDDQQSRTLRRLMARESRALFVKHAPTIMQYSVEAIQTRAAGEPFTPDQVARWTELAMPIAEESRARVDAAATEFMKELTPDQQSLVLADLASADRRFEDVLVMAEDWKAGNWSPEQWGLTEDPIQMAGQTFAEGEADAPGAMASGGAEGNPAATQNEANPAVADRRAREKQQASDQAAARAAENRPQDPPSAREKASNRARALDAWEKYVQEVIDKYTLNETQQALAWRMHKMVESRKERFAKRTERQVEAAESRFRTNTEGLKTAVASLKEEQRKREEALFAQLKERLETIPTRAQRAAAEATDKAPKNDKQAQR